LHLTITALNEFGYGVGQKAGQVLSVARTVPGDQVVVNAPKTSEKWTSAELLRVVKPGPDRVESPCKAFERGCGGCQWLHLSYPAQLAWKEKNLANLLRTRARYSGPILPIVGMNAPEAYRNKLSLKNVQGHLFFVPETEGKTLAPSDCLAQTLVLQKAWSVLKKWKVPGGVSQLHLRSNAAGQIGAHVMAETPPQGSFQELFQLLPNLVGVGLTTRKGYQLVAGEEVLVQELSGLTWLIPHNGFFQTNQFQAGVLLELVQKEARLTPESRLLDLYCGAGFFGLALARQAGSVLGIEENSQSVAAARASARASGILNAEFVSGDLGAVLGAQKEVKTREVAVVDPPRDGLLPRALEALIARAPQRIVYISCYPASLVRDFKALTAAGWKGVSCTPVDMFPHTSHLETVLTLER
jgi:23S rRNA (uracil1939-C5)-methyltransferase